MSTDKSLLRIKDFFCFSAFKSDVYKLALQAPFFWGEGALFFCFKLQFSFSVEYVYFLFFFFQELTAFSFLLFFFSVVFYRRCTLL